MPDRNDQELALRLRELAREHGQNTLARRTGTSPANISRYLRGRRVPARFCAALVREFGISASWLLTGEGPARLEDTLRDESATAADLVRLVRAMRAVTTMRLGALSGRHHLAVLRELNESMRQYELARRQLTPQAVPAFRGVLDALERALARYDTTQADDYMNTADQLALLCDDEDCHRRLLALKARRAFLQSDMRTAVQEHRRLLRRVLVPDAAMSDNDFELIARTVMALLQSGRVREARRVANAGAALAADADPLAPGAAALHFVRGGALVESGAPARGLGLMQQYAPHQIPRRRLAARAMLLQAMFICGAVGVDEIVAAANKEPAPPMLLTLFPAACHARDTAALEASLKLAARADWHDPFWIPWARALLQAATGQTRTALDSLAELGEETDPAGVNLAKTAVLVACGRRSAARAAHARAVAAVVARDAELALPFLLMGTHLRNCLELYSPGNPARAQAAKQVRRMVRRGYGFLAPLLLTSKDRPSSARVRPEPGRRPHSRA